MTAALDHTTNRSAAWFADGERQRAVWLKWLAVGVSLLLAMAIIAFEVVTPVILLSFVLAGAVIWRPRIGLYFAFGFVLLFEAGSFDKMMEPGAYFMKGLSATIEVQELIVSPLEILLVITIVAWLGRRLAGKPLDFRRGDLFVPTMIFGAMILFGLVRGAIGGGGLNTALWEARALVYLVICYVLGANLIRSPKHLGVLFTIAIVTTSLFSLEAIYRRLEFVSTGVLWKIGVPREFAYAHESVILLGTVILLILGWQVLGAPLWQRLLAPFSLAALSLAFLATERRAGVIAIAVAFLLLSLIFLCTHRKAFFVLAVPVLVAGALYMPLFWRHNGLVGQPARAVRSLYQPDARDAASNKYRVQEMINIRATIESDPILGIGFGREFLFVVPLPDLSWWPFWKFEPHNNLLWVWLKTGYFGFTVFIYLMGSAIARATHAFRVLRDVRSRAFAIMALSALVMTLVFCWVDLGLVSPRVTVFLGVLMGVLGVLHQIHRAPQAQRTSAETQVTPLYLAPDHDVPTAAMPFWRRSA